MYDTSHSKYGNSSVIQHELGYLVLIDQMVTYTKQF